MLDRNEAVRNQSVAGVEQEAWSMFLTDNFIRREMALTALAHSAQPSVMSFKYSLLFIHNFFIAHSGDPATGRLPERLRDLREELWRYRLPPRRKERSAPRHVKIKISNYAKKPPRGSEIAFNAEPSGVVSRGCLQIPPVAQKVHFRPVCPRCSVAPYHQYGAPSRLASGPNWTSWARSGISRHPLDPKQAHRGGHVHTAAVRDRGRADQR